MCIICAVGQDEAGWTASTAAPSAHAGWTLDEYWIARGRTLLARYPSVDIHAHPGRFFLREGEDATPFERRYGAPFVGRAVSEMHEGGVSAAFFATVADRAVLHVSDHGIAEERPFAPGEALTDHERQLDRLDALCAEHALRVARCAGDIQAAHADHDVACLAAVEGGDFIEDRLERIEQASRRGVRLVTIVHYRVNQIGDIQTEAPVHGGLSPLGRDIIAELHRAGIIIDLSHATEKTSADVCAMASRPVILSHTNIARPGESHPRLISLDHAKMVTETDGLVGVVPMGIGHTGPMDYIDTILRTVDLLGVDHVAIGTDMDFTYKPVFTSYADWPLLAGGLLARGLSESECAQVMGGNMLRVMRQTGASERKTH